MFHQACHVSNIRNTLRAWLVWWQVYSWAVIVSAPLPPTQAHLFFNAKNLFDSPQSRLTVCFFFCVFVCVRTRWEQRRCPSVLSIITWARSCMTSRRKRRSRSGRSANWSSKQGWAEHSAAFQLHLSDCFPFSPFLFESSVVIIHGLVTLCGPCCHTLRCLRDKTRATC